MSQQEYKNLISGVTSKTGGPGMKSTRSKRVMVKDSSKSSSRLFASVRKQGSKFPQVSPSEVRGFATSLSALRVKVEHKQVIPRFRGSDAPVLLSSPDCGYVFSDTKESDLLRSTMSRMFAGREYSFRIASAYTMSSSGAGSVNSVLANSSLTSNADFIALSGVFNEFFIEMFRIDWQPVSMFNYPLTGVAATSVSSLPLIAASLQHAQASYTNLPSATTADGVTYTNTGLPFKHSWVNPESPKSTVVVAPVLTGGPCQSWAQVGDIASYTGSVQLISPSAPPAIIASQVLGSFMVEWLVRFRVRV
jgi:hypothetical protein